MVFEMIEVIEPSYCLLLLKNSHLPIAASFIDSSATYPAHAFRNGRSWRKKRQSMTPVFGIAQEILILPKE